MASKGWERFSQPSYFPKRINVPSFRGAVSPCSLPFQGEYIPLAKRIEVTRSNNEVVTVGVEEKPQGNAIRKTNRKRL